MYILAICTQAEDANHYTTYAVLLFEIKINRNIVYSHFENNLIHRFKLNNDHIQRLSLRFYFLVSSVDGQTQSKLQECT
jgi:hypothetical protein